MQRFPYLRLVIVLSFAWAAGCSEAPTPARSSDVGCDVGATKKQACNVCQCTKEQGWICTLRNCRDVPRPGDVPSSRDATAETGPPGDVPDAGSPPSDAATPDTTDVRRRDTAPTDTDPTDVADTASDVSADTRTPDAPSDAGATDTGATEADATDAGGDTTVDTHAGVTSDARDASEEIGVSDVSGDARVTFACGSTQRCEVGREYCLEEISGVSPPDGGASSFYSCKTYGSCGPDPDCSCLKNREASGGGSTATCSNPGSGVFEVTVGRP